MFTKKAALQDYANKLVALYYNVIMQRTKHKNQRVGFKLQDIVLQASTHNVTNYVKNYLLKIKKTLQKSFNYVNSKNEQNKKVM